jgi:hypothetical protein
MSHFEWIDLPNSGTVGARSFEWLGQEEVLPEQTITPGVPSVTRSADIPIGVSQGMLFRVPGDPRWHYVVASGDFPAKIAEKGLGDRSRWPDLTRANPTKPKSTAAECAANPAQCPPGNFKNLFANEVLLWPENWPVNKLQTVDLFGSGDGKGGFSAAGMSGGTIALAVAVLAALGLAVANWGKA